MKLLSKNSTRVFGLIALMGAFSFSASAAEMIQGAFGKKLGDKFDPASAIGTKKTASGTPMYQFNPESPFRSFSKYYVMITPATQKIYCIWGTGNVESTDIGKQEQAVLMSLLKDKYGSAEQPGIFDDLDDSRRFSQGNRYILTKVTGLDGLEPVKIEIRYYDKPLQKLAEKERVDTEKTKVDKSGL